MSNCRLPRNRRRPRFAVNLVASLWISFAMFAMTDSTADDQTRKLSGAVSSSKSRVEQDVHRLEFPVERIFRNLHQVDSVRATRERPRQFTHRIIHIRNWHFLPKDLFAAEFRQINGAKSKQSTIDPRYEEFLSEVEAVQQEQIAMLRRLIQQHGLTVVYYEGLIKDEVPLYRSKVKSLRKLGESIPEIEFNIRELRLFRRELEESDEQISARIENATNIEQKLKRVLNNYRYDLLQIGAAGRLLMSGELKDVRPVDDRSQLARSNPQTSNGSIRRVSKTAIESREDSQVRCLLKSSGTAVVILGGGHDLTNNVDRLSNGKCQYVRVTTRKLREFAAK